MANDCRAEPPGKPLHAVVAARSVTDDRMQPQSVKAVFYESRRHFDCDPIPSPIIGGQLRPRTAFFGFLPDGDLRSRSHDFPLENST
jgi:hypothetical protein